ncbi:MAG: hypothetical protein ABI411_09205 [Tahibacter sp.]
MRWFWLGMTVFGLALAFMTRSPGLMGLGLLAGFVGMFCTIFTVAGERIQERARSDSAMLTPEILAQMRAKAKSQQSANTQSMSDARLDEPSR